MNTTHRSRIAAEVRAAVARDGISRGDLAAKLNINPRNLIDTALAATAA